MTTMLPTYSNDHLATLSERQLLELMIDDEDRVPFNVITECARRAASMEQALNDWFDRRDKLDEPSEGEWWLLIHCIMILGLIPSEQAGLTLVKFMRRVQDDDDLLDWCGDKWPGLFANKPRSVVFPLRALVQDRDFDWYFRTQALQALVARESQTDVAALEAALSWLADIASDESEDLDLRWSAADTLLDFPRPQFRSLLEKFATEYDALDARFDLSEVSSAFEKMQDEPEWQNFADLWSFYSPQAIEARQQRWDREEDSDELLGLDDDDYFLDSDTDHFVTTYIRETPKIGRNDPCPCGSGKKYKKCCLATEGL